MSHDVIMPALGMAQDSGLLVAWRKQPGEAVAVGDALFEVETDKATMEVEATAAGFLSAVTAGNGADVPVGQVIARIVETAEAVDATPPAGKAPDAPPPPAPPVAAPVPPPTKPPAPAPVPRPVVAAAGGDRILASPKAKRLAAEQGLDLGLLAEAGHPQPYHVADLDRLRALAPMGRSVLTARADATALDALLRQAKAGPDSARLFAVFAAGAWRQVFAQELGVAIQRPDGGREGDGALLLTDLTATRLTGYMPTGGLALSVAREGAAVSLTLAFTEAALPFASAAAWLDDLAARIEDPVRQLV